MVESKNFICLLRKLSAEPTESSSIDGINEHAKQCVESLESSQRDAIGFSEKCDLTLSQILMKTVTHLNETIANDELLSVADRKDISSAMKMIICISIEPNLPEQCVTSMNKDHIKEAWWRQTVFLQNKVLLCNATKFLCDLRSSGGALNNMTESFLEQILLALMQIQHSHSDVIDCNAKTYLNTILTTAPKSDLMQIFIYLQKDEQCPEWVRSNCGECLSKLLCMDDGLLCLINALLQSDENSLQDFTKLLALVKIVTSCPLAYEHSPKIYYEKICSQISKLAVFYSQQPNLQTVLSCLVRTLYQIYPFAVSKLIFKPLVDPILISKLQKPDSFTEIIHVFHTVYCCGPQIELTEKFMRPLQTLFDIFSTIFVQNYENVDILKKKLLDLIDLKLENNVESFVNLLVSQSDVQYVISDGKISKIDHFANGRDIPIDAIFDSLMKCLPEKKCCVIAVKTLRYCCNETAKIGGELKRVDEDYSRSDQLLTMENCDSLSKKLLAVSGLLEHITEIYESHLLSDARAIVHICNDLLSSPDVSVESISLSLGLLGSVLLVSDNFDPDTNQDSIRDLMQSLSDRVSDVESEELRESAQALIQLLAAAIGEIPPHIRSNGKLNSSAAAKVREGSENQSKTVEEQIDECLMDLNDEFVSVKGHALIVLTRIINDNRRKFNPSIITDIYRRISPLLSDDDSYIFLSSINVVCALAYCDINNVLPAIIEQFTNCKHEPDIRAKAAETITKVVQQLGDLSCAYVDCLVCPLMELSYTKDEDTVCSALSSLAVVVLHASSAITKYYTQILSMLDSFLSVSIASSLQRAAVNLLRSLLNAAGKNHEQLLTSQLREVYEHMKLLCMRGHDPILQVHAQLCLQELDEIIRHVIFPLEKTVGRKLIEEID